mmetsp:Transcript_7698/g.8801  ORF Transcript_7698/g.8801 Transcript_7698/m.8801 type:complete len:148 (-) Transcript_7698:93-536(-)
MLKDFDRMTEVPHRSLMNVLDLPLDAKHRVNQFLSFPEIENAKKAGAYGQMDLNNQAIEEIAARDPHRDPILDDYFIFRFVEKKVRGLVSRGQEQETQEWKDVLTKRVQHPKVNEETEEADAEEDSGGEDELKKKKSEIESNQMGHK